MPRLYDQLRWLIVLVATIGFIMSGFTASVTASDDKEKEIWETPTAEPYDIDNSSRIETDELLIAVEDWTSNQTSLDTNEFLAVVDAWQNNETV